MGNWGGRRQVETPKSSTCPKRSHKATCKTGDYHIQNVNSTHHRLKKWLDNTFWGVSTKYLRQYLEWFRIEKQLKDFVPKTVESITTYERYRNIGNGYQNLIGYFGSDCATYFGVFVPVISVQTVPLITFRFVPINFGQELKRFDLCQF